MSFFKPFGSRGEVPGVMPGGTGRNARSGPGVMPAGSIIDPSPIHQGAAARASGERGGRAKSSDARAREGSKGPSALRREDGRVLPDRSVFDHWPVKPWEPDPPPLVSPSSSLRAARNAHLRRLLSDPGIPPIPRDTWQDPRMWSSYDPVAIKPGVRNPEPESLARGGAAAPRTPNPGTGGGGSTVKPSVLHVSQDPGSWSGL